MCPNRGTDAATEQRQLRSRQGKEGLDRWLEAVFYGASEVTLLGLPALFLLMDVEPNGPAKFAGLLAWLVLSTTVGTIRGGWLDLAPVWIRKTPWTVPALLVFHSGVLWVGAVGGASVEATTGSALASVAVAVVVPLVGAIAVAVAADAAGLGAKHR